MNVETLLEHTIESNRIEAFYNALKSVGDMGIAQLRGDSWFDDLYVTGHGPKDKTLDDEGWMDDLDVAA
jgi:hypothetical protein